MSIGLLAFIIGILTFVGLVSAFVGVFGMRVSVSERLDRASTADRSATAREFIRRAAGTLRPLGEVVPRSPDEMTRQEKKLVQAGIRGKDAVFLFYGIQAAIVIGMILVFLVTGLMLSNPILWLLVSLLVGAAVPDIWLARRIGRRQLAVQNALPDAMDLAVISMEAGLGLDQTLLRIGQEFEKVHPDLSDEFRLYALEMNLGRTRVEAFRNLAERTGVPDLRALVAVLIQTDRFGTSIADALRVFSDELRTKRRQRAEEKAAQLAVKMIFPMLLFIFPGVFIVILGPAVIAIMRTLLPALAGGTGG